MSFDETLRRAFDTLTDRLRDEMASAISPVADELATAAQTDRDLAATQAAAAAAADARADAERDAASRIAEAERDAASKIAEAEQRAAARIEEAERAALSQIAEAERAAAARGEDAERAAAQLAEAERAAAARIADAERAAASQIADAQRTAASQIADAERAAEAQLSAAVAAAESAARDPARPPAPAASEQLVNAIRAIDRASSLSETLDALLFAAGREAARAGILLVRGEEAIGWRFVGSGGFGFAFDAANPLSIALGDGHAGVIGEAVRSGVAASSETAGGLSAPPFELPEGRVRVALPIPMSGQVVALLYADQDAEDDPARKIAIAWPSTLEVLTRHAARTLEALTAFKAARAIMDRQDVLAPAPAASAAPTPGSIAAPSADEDDAARRYARLLVSEIKLYHEPAVTAGRRERDLAARLGGEIARARVLYEQRVPADVRQRTGYFDAELVRTLANGDAALLGQPT